ncbi:hypothetical protein F1609_00160 [Massilia sp. CCM 8693]|uniref:Uncharacterized protein n=2 Tax=Massilia aquatica TaxID=2609000 RepID=A0ABX0M4N6_9BURK|nr:hypothetical protein [Massilia aquatica]
MKILRGPSYVKEPKKVISSGNYADLSREQIDQGVVALVVHCNLSGGSILDMNLYRLIRTYLWSPQARSEINAVVGRYGL